MKPKIKANSWGYLLWYAACANSDAELEILDKMNCEFYVKGYI